MIELKNDQLRFSFPDVHPQAGLTVSFQRTLRIPDDGRTYPLPPGLGSFPTRHVDDYSNQVPESWIEHGGVMLPMYQSEAMWIRFKGNMVLGQGTYPFAVRILTGKIDAVTGEEYVAGFRRNPQNYVVAPHQPWIDGYCVSKGVVRQFVAMPLGGGYTAEEQITGSAEHGGVQIVVCPMKREAFDRYFAKREYEVVSSHRLKRKAGADFECLESRSQMGIAPGGKIKQQIYADSFATEDWDEQQIGKCFVHIANSQSWRQITHSAPPTKPFTAKAYTNAGLPWFDYYDDQLDTVDTQESLQRLLSVNTLKHLWHGKKLSGNKSCDPKLVIAVRNGLRKDQVRETNF